MAVKFICPECARNLSFQDDYAGRRAKCPGCGFKVRIPDPEKHRFGRIKCVACGTPVEAWDIHFEEDGIKCPSCGERVTRTKPVEAAAPIPEIIDAEYIEESAGGKKTRKRGKAAGGKEKENKRALIIGCIIGGVIGALVGASAIAMIVILGG
jgi:DNA-directed RNA polymerase subunit RPC12/RpoP